MNIAKLLGRENQNEAEDEKLLEALLAGQNTKSRAQHYIFAHRLLPQVAYHYGVRAAFLLGDEEKGHEYLLRFWNDSGEGLPPEDLVEPAGLSSFTRREGDLLITIVTLPEPQSVSEAHFTAIVCGPLPAAPKEATEKELSAFEEAFLSAPTQYYTLEHGVQLSPLQKRTVFCSWTADGTHLNFGDGPAPDAEAFFAFIVAKLEDPPELKGSAGPGGVTGPGETVH
jgi:hypothetical protein